MLRVHLNFVRHRVAMGRVQAWVWKRLWELAELLAD